MGCAVEERRDNQKIAACCPGCCLSERALSACRISRSGTLGRDQTTALPYRIDYRFPSKSGQRLVKLFLHRGVCLGGFRLFCNDGDVL
jgi:hypothetical protein